jgi:hypothetical protein
LSFLILLLGCRPGAHSAVPATITPAPAVTVLGQRQYVVRQQVELINEGPGRPEKQNIWVALIRDFPPYQEVQSMEVLPKRYTLVTDEDGNQYAEFDFSRQPAGSTRTVTIDYRLAVNEITYDLSACAGDLPDFFTRPELHIESANPQIVALSEDLSRGKESACERVRAF